MSFAWRFFVALALAVFSANAQQPGVGKLLVASRISHDPDFAQSVILLVYYGPEGVIGLMINRPWDVPVTELFPDLKQARARLYQGGPVAVGVRGLVRSKTKLEDADPVCTDVYVVSNVKKLKTMIAANTSPDTFRVYGGSTGWSVAQLKGEISDGLWRVLPAGAAAVFDPNPSTLWSRQNENRQRER